MLFSSAATACKQPCILVSNSTDILSININNGAASSIASGLTRAVAIDIDYQTGHVYWSDIVERKIKQTNIVGGNSVTVIQVRTVVLYFHESNKFSKER